ncbi:MAG: hypothetical protein Q9208_004502 [Pyrenodesmia sp. 3 TL-2023]
MSKGAAVGGGGGGRLDVLLGRDAADIPFASPAGLAAVAEASATTLPTMAPEAPLPIFNPAGWGTAHPTPIPALSRASTSTSKSKSQTRTINPQAATGPPTMNPSQLGSTSTNPSLPTSTSAPSSPIASPGNNTIPPGVTAAIALGVVIAIFIAGIGGFLYRRNRRRQHSRSCVQELTKHNERFERPVLHPQPNTGGWSYEKKMVSAMESPHPAYGKHRLFGTDGKDEEGWRWSSGRQRWSKERGRGRHELDSGWHPSEMQGVRF